MQVEIVITGGDERVETMNALTELLKSRGLEVTAGSNSSNVSRTTRRLETPKETTDAG